MTDLTRSFRMLLRQCLQICPTDELVIVYDETLEPFWDELVDAVVEDNFSCTFIHLPIPYQRRIASHDRETRLPTGVWTAICEADVIVTALTGDVTLAGVRRTVVAGRGNARRGCRLAHIPGISREVLEVLENSPVADIERDCELVAWALGEARQGVLDTTGCDGTQHRLTFDLGGWYREPLMSPGVIYHDSWGNIPPGESFFCPAHRSVNGTVVINGSVPDHVCGPGEEVVLLFDGGRLVSWTTTSAPMRRFFDHHAAAAAGRCDAQWNTFAEIGVGLNPAITELTGNPLFDEKALGTVHIAIGDNYGFGHDIKSDIHADLVIWRPSLFLDGHSILRDGALRRDEVRRWRSTLEFQQIAPAAITSLQLRRERFDLHGRWADTFVRKLNSNGRVGYVQVAAGVESQLLSRLAEAMLTEEHASTESVRRVGRQLGASDEALASALGTLAHYGMIAVTPDPLVG